MQRFSLDRRRFAGHPQRGFPHPSGGSPSPSKSPPEGGDPAPRGAGACRPPVSPSGSPSTPRGTPTGFPRLRRLPLPSGLATKGASEARRALARRRGWKKIKVAAPIAAAGRQRWKCGEGEAVGGQGWGQPVGSPPGLSTGCPCPCPRTGVAARRSRSDLHISTARGSNSAPSGGLFCPAGLTTSVQEV